MDDLVIKSTPVVAPVRQGAIRTEAAAALAGLASSFREMLQKTGIRMDNGINEISNRAGISGVGDRVDTAATRDDGYRAADDRGRDRVDPAQRSDDRPEGKDHARAGERGDGYGRDNASDDRGGRDDSYASARGEDRDDGRNGDNRDAKAARDDAPRNDGEGSRKSASNDGDGVKSADGKGQSNGEGKNKGAEGTDGQGNVTTTATDAANAKAGLTAEVATTVLTSLIASAEALADGGQASSQGQENAVDGLTTAVENVTAKGAENVSAAGADNQAQTAVENTAKVTPTKTGYNSGPQNNHQSQGQANASAQAQASAAQQAAIKAEGETGPVNPVETQAAGLAKSIGEGNRAQVNVTVNHDADVLTSKPGATLNATSVIKPEATNQSSGGTNTGAHGQSTGGQNAAAQAQAQNAQVAAQQTTTAQNAQTQAAAQSGTDAKGLVQTTATTTSTGGTVHSGGGEGGAQANTGNVNGNQQTQQTQAQKAAEQAQHAQKPVNAGNSVVDQISVKITKAIQSGNDKITIHLRPANLGRVEVKIEMAHDSRMTAMVIADKPETLDLLKSDSRELQRALQDAGLHTNAGDLSFNLRGQDNHQREAGNGGSGGLSIGEEILELDESVIEGAVIASDGTVISNGRIDVRV